MVRTYFASPLPASGNIFNSPGCPVASVSIGQVFIGGENVLIQKFLWGLGFRLCNSSPFLCLFLAIPFFSSSKSTCWTKGKIICKCRETVLPQERKEEEKTPNPLWGLQRKIVFSLEQVPPAPNPQITSTLIIYSLKISLIRNGQLYFLKFNLHHGKFSGTGWLALDFCNMYEGFAFLSINFHLSCFILVYLHIHQTWSDFMVRQLHAAALFFSFFFII